MEDDYHIIQKRRENVLREYVYLSWINFSGEFYGISQISFHFDLIRKKLLLKIWVSLQNLNDVWTNKQAVSRLCQKHKK
jgi:hypothetical protein